jgi:hypothetical protein
VPIRRQSWPGQKSILVREVNIHYKQAQPSRLPHRVPKSPCILSFVYLSLELHTAPGTPHSQHKECNHPAGIWFIIGQARSAGDMPSMLYT